MLALCCLCRGIDAYSHQSNDFHDASAVLSACKVLLPWVLVTSKQADDKGLHIRSLPECATTWTAFLLSSAYLRPERLCMMRTWGCECYPGVRW